MKNIFKTITALSVLVCFAYSARCQVTIGTSGTYQHFYPPFLSKNNNTPTWYRIPDVTVFVDVTGVGTAIIYPDFNNNHEQLIGKTREAPRGNIWQVYSMTGVPNDPGGNITQALPRTYTYQPKLSDVSSNTVLTTIMAGSIQNLSDGEYHAGYPVIVNTSAISVEQPHFINQGAIAYICQSDPVIQLSDYFQGAATTETFFLDDLTHTNQAITQIDPSATPAGVHTITAFKHYDNGDFIQTIKVNIVAPITITFNQYSPNVCENAGIINILALPTGGTWSGTAVDNNGNFNPATAGVGTFILTYSFVNPNKAQNPNGCASVKVATISVVPLPAVSAGNPITVCFNGGIQDLKGTPAGGIWSGAGVSNNSFDPQSAGIGNFPLQYSFIDPTTSCTGTSTIQATVKAVPDITVPPDASVCINSGLLNLSAIPAGGVWSGTGVVNNSFDPAKAGVGTYVLTYSYQDQNAGCTSTATYSVTVLAIPDPTAPPNFTICYNANPVLLQGATPLGGEFTGDGTTNGLFNPLSAGLGNHTITYAYKDPNAGCTGYTSFIITVKPLPGVSAGPGFSLCVNAAPRVLTGQPAGGIWSGDGITGQTFIPVLAGAGKHVLTYTFADPTIGCSNADTLTAFVNPIPVLNVGDDTTVCNNGAPITLRGLPTGGTWSGPGINGSLFLASQANLNQNSLVYNYTDLNGCSTSITKMITVLKSIPVSAGNALSLCINSAPYDLAKDASIPGGIWSGTGVSGGFFNPGQTKAGVFNITYSYSNASGCASTASKHIEVINIPGKVSITGTVAGCNGSVVELYAQADSAANYAWYHLNDDSPFTYGQQISYTISKTEQLYCVGLNPLSCGLTKLNAAAIQITSLSPTASLLSSQTAVPFGGLVQFRATNSYNTQNYQWSFGDGGISTEQNPSHYYYARGNFKVSVVLTSPENCSDSLVLENPITVGKDDTIAIAPVILQTQGADDSPYEVKIYPSPFKDHIYLTFHLGHAQQVALRVYDTFGKLIRTQSLTGQAGDNKFTLTDLNSLIVKNYYLVMLKSDELNQLIKVLKM